MGRRKIKIDAIFKPSLEKIMLDRNSLSYRLEHGVEQQYQALFAAAVSGEVKAQKDLAMAYYDGSDSRL
ncbi:MAG: hypothetical protein GC137_02685 [Alphaproteobacteria bacterium]|nr:hypothetical protein [Alphaproteobacteria bacterium]